jgi:3-isopropylmalate dehydrogenase
LKSGILAPSPRLELIAPGDGAGDPWASAAGRGIANPYAMIMSAQMLLAWLGQRKQNPAATKAASAMEKVIAERRALTTI